MVRGQYWSMHFRLLTYNIHKGIGGVDRRYDLDRVVETIRYYGPDVALLQEVDDGVPRSRRHVQVELLAEATGLPHYEFQRNVSLTTGGYGNAILSRWPLFEPARIDLTLRPKKRRGAIVARCRLPVDGHAKTLILATLHLGLSGIERQWQLRRLMRAESLANLRRRAPLVVGGDFNDVWGALGRRTLIPAGFVSAGPSLPTFPAVMPLRPLDRVFYRGDLRAVHALVGRTEIARRSSDHLPVVVDFEFTRK
jgi:endonuclease/exonuclease/phosphatase family metal-dependent hydrolase